MGDVYWYDVASATHGLSLTESQGAAWDMLLKKEIPDVKNADVCSALCWAMEKGLRPEGYRMVVSDLISWIKLYRSVGTGDYYVIGKTIYFKDKPMICGHHLSRLASDAEIEKAKKEGVWKKM